jgi:hypothetical protein
MSFDGKGATSVDIQDDSDDEMWLWDEVDECSLDTDELMMNSLDSDGQLHWSSTVPVRFGENRFARPTSPTSPTSQTGHTGPTDQTSQTVQSGQSAQSGQSGPPDPPGLAKPEGKSRGARKRFVEKKLKLRGAVLIGDSMAVKRRLRRHRCKLAWKARKMHHERKVRYLAEAALHKPSFRA